MTVNTMQSALEIRQGCRYEHRTSCNTFQLWLFHLLSQSLETQYIDYTVRS